MGLMVHLNFRRYATTSCDRFYRDKSQARIDVFGRAPREAYLSTGKETEFFVRTGKKTIPLKGRDMANYIKANW